MSSSSRDNIEVGLRPRQWVCLLAKVEDPLRGAVGGNSMMDFRFFADPLNTANTIIRFDDSPDGVTWTVRQTLVAALVPGGEDSAQALQQQDYCRVMCYSEGSGKIRVTALRTNPAENPALWPDSPTEYEG